VAAKKAIAKTAKTAPPVRGNVVAAVAKTCFFIGPIGSEGSEERRRSDDVCEYVVRPCAAELKLEVIQPHTIDESGIITDQIVNLLIEADIVVADFWSLNPNVFYELGVRHAFRRPAIHLYAEEIPFDVRAMRGIPLDHTNLRSVEAAKGSVLKQMKGYASGGVLTFVAGECRTRLQRSSRPAPT
jgi:hypothetical protein